MPYPTNADLAARIRADATDPAIPGIAAAAQAYIDSLAFVRLPEGVRNEAYQRFVGYLYDAPEAAPGSGFANAWRNSGADALTSRWRKRGAGVIGEAAATSTASTPAGDGNPVTNVQITSAGELILTFADGTSTSDALPAGGIDQTARDSAADAQATADANEAALAAMPGSYVLPAAAPGVRGGVQAITAAIVDTGTSTGVFGWAISHVRRVVNAIVPAWARDDSTTIPPDKFGTDSIDHNKLGTDSVRRRHIDDGAVDLDRTDPTTVRNRLLPDPAGLDDGTRAVVDGEAWVMSAPAPPAGKPQWLEMAQRGAGALANGIADDMVLRPDGLTVFADAAAVRTAIGDGTISMVALQRSDSDAQAFGAIAPNFISSAGANFALQFRFPREAEEVTVRFTPTAITVTPSFDLPGGIRLDLGVFA